MSDWFEMFTVVLSGVFTFKSIDCAKFDANVGGI
jgi:hypothetical protein